MNYSKKYNLRKGIVWITHRLKQERWCIKKRTQTLSAKYFAQIRIEMLEDILRHFRRRK